MHRQNINSQTQSTKSPRRNAWLFFILAFHSMNTPFFIARQLVFREKKFFSGFIVRISILAITLSTAVMITGSAITRGYQEVIRQKFYACWGHLHVMPFLPDPNNLQQESYFAYDQKIVDTLLRQSEIKSVNPFAIQSVILKANNEIEGLLIKGITPQTAKQFSDDYILAGTLLPHRAGNAQYLLISESTSQKLRLQIGDKAIVYLQIGNEEQPRIRPVRISGIYKTGLEEYDNHFAIAGLDMIDYLTQRGADSINGYEIQLKHPESGQEIKNRLLSTCIPEPLQIYTLEERFSNVFSWLRMMKMNERIIVIIMLLIALINMVSALLILVLERTRMIGVLKAIGMRNQGIRSVFVFTSAWILGMGILLGTLLGVGLCWIQQYTGCLQLDEKTYYIKTVPVFLDVRVIAGIDLLTLLLGILILFVPAYIIRTISPVKALRFQ